MSHSNEVTKFIDDLSIDNIYNTFPKIIGIETNINIITDDKKNIGMVILVSGDVPFFLGDYVEYNINKVKWKGSKFDVDQKLLYIIDPFWCKNYKPNPNVKVPIKVYNPKTNSVIEELCMMNKKQFIKNRLTEFYRDWAYITVASVENFNRCRNKGYYYAINSTVKNYRIDQDILKRAIGKINRQVDNIIKEWNLLSNRYYENKESLKLIRNLIEKNNKGNVVEFKTGTKP